MVPTEGVFQATVINPLSFVAPRRLHCPGLAPWAPWGECDAGKPPAGQLCVWRVRILHTARHICAGGKKHLVHGGIPEVALLNKDIPSICSLNYL